MRNDLVDLVKRLQKAGLMVGEHPWSFHVPRYAEDIAIEICTKCRAEVEYEDCWNCGGEGGRDLYEEDPLAHAPGEWADCTECDGRGTLPFCPNCGVVESRLREIVTVGGDGVL